MKKILSLAGKITLASLLLATPAKFEEMKSISISEKCTATYSGDSNDKYKIYALECSDSIIYDFEGDSYIDTFCNKNLGCVQHNETFESEKEKEIHEFFFNRLKSIMHQNGEISIRIMASEIMEIIKKAYEDTEKKPIKIYYNPLKIIDLWIG